MDTANPAATFLFGILANLAVFLLKKIQQFITKKYLIKEMRKIRNILLASLALCMCVACGSDDDGPERPGGLNLFSVNRDKELGREVDMEIRNNPQTYPILSSNQHPEAYEHLNRIRETLLNSGQVYFRDDFDWECKIIRDDNTLNAFATPGGYLYFYTGLIKYLENERDFAGVFGHEIAHSDRRHSTQRLTKQFGVAVLLSFLLGNEPGLLAEIANAALTLSFSRADEREADEFSVIYLDPTEYQGNGAAGFFEKLEREGQSSDVPEFLSTHPSPDNRVESINRKWQEMGGRPGAEGDPFVNRYRDFQNSLP